MPYFNLKIVRNELAQQLSNRRLSTVYTKDDLRILKDLKLAIEILEISIKRKLKSQASKG